MQAILNRRSIRKYTDEPVADEEITLLLKAAMAAPSANNYQPWQFVVIRDREILAQVPKHHPYSAMVPGAQVAILVVADPSRQEMEGYWAQDCAAATQNILIGATDLGLGAVWLGVYPRQERIDGMRKLLGVPASVVPFSLVSIGYPAQQLPPSDRYDEARIHRDRW